MKTVRIATEGGAGVAVGQGDSDTQGMLNAITVNYGTTAPNTTRVRVFLVNGDAETEILDRTGNTPFIHYPTIPLMDKAGVEVGRVVPYGNFNVRIDVTASNELEEAVTISIQ